MLEIKGIVPLHTASLAYCSLIPLEMLPASLQESTMHRAKFLEGAFVSEKKRQHLNQVLSFWGSVPASSCT